MNFRFFDQKSIFDLQGPFLVKKSKFSFFDQNRFETSRHHFWANFGRKIELSSFWPRIDFWPPRSIFGQKIEIFIFRPKIDLRPLGTIFGQILVENLNFRVFDQKSIFYPQNQFLVKNLIFHFFNKSRFETSTDHFRANNGREIELSSLWPKIDFWTPGSIFGQKIELFIFRPKINLNLNL